VTDDGLRRVLAEARDQYLHHYRAVIHRAKANRPQAVPELLIELNAADSGLVNRLTRVDVIWGGAAQPSIIEANVDPPAKVECIYSAVGPPVVRAFSLVWNACEILCPEPIVLSSEFDRWFVRWLDLDDAKAPDAEGLAGVIHSVTKPGRVGDKWGFSIDLGSAPADAVLELLELPEFIRAGVVEVGSFTYGREG
jgi:hypothetical protein